MNKIKVGNTTYEWFELKETLPNPQWDKRQRHDWRVLESFQANKRFLRTTTDFTDGHAWYGIRLKPSMADLYEMHPLHKGYDAIMANCVPVEATVHELMKALSVSPAEVIDRLMKYITKQETIEAFVVAIYHKEHEESEVVSE